MGTNVVIFEDRFGDESWVTWCNGLVRSHRCIIYKRLRENVKMLTRVEEILESDIKAS